LFSRQHDRTRALIYRRGPVLGFAGWDDADRDPAEVRARLLAELGEGGTPRNVWSMSEGDITFALGGNGEACDRAGAAVAVA
jgi:hypothetical protein